MEWKVILIYNLHANMWRQSSPQSYGIKVPSHEQKDKHTVDIKQNDFSLKNRLSWIPDWQGYFYLCNRKQELFFTLATIICCETQTKTKANRLDHRPVGSRIKAFKVIIQICWNICFTKPVWVPEIAALTQGNCNRCFLLHLGGEETRRESHVLSFPRIIKSVKIN